MNLTIPIFHISAARKLLTRLRFERFTLPVLTHVLATIDAAGLSLAVTDLDHWLETRVTAIIGPSPLGRFLIPAEALKVAARGDKGSSAHFAYAETADGTTLTLTTSCCGLSVKSVYHLVVTAEDYPARLVVKGRIRVLPKETFVALDIVAGCASTHATRYVLNGVHFTPKDGGMLIATDGRRLPVTIEGHPPEITFDPRYLADAIEIGPTLRLVDKLSPGITEGSSGNFCVLMSLRFTEGAAIQKSMSATPTSAVAA